MTSRRLTMRAMVRLQTSNGPLFCYASGRGGACTVTDAFVLSLKSVMGWVPLTRELPFVVPS